MSRDAGSIPAASTKSHLREIASWLFSLDLRKATFLEIRHRNPENARMSDKKWDNLSDAGHSIANIENTSFSRCLLMWAVCSTFSHTCLSPFAGFAHRPCRIPIAPTSPRECEEQSVLEGLATSAMGDLRWVPSREKAPQRKDAAIRDGPRRADEELDHSTYTIAFTKQWPRRVHLFSSFDSQRVQLALRPSPTNCSSPLPWCPPM